MAKKDKNDRVPIQFYIPGPGGKGPKVPIPTNQPNWIYKSGLNSKPDSFGWFLITCVIVFTVILTVILISASMFTSPLWIAVITFGVLSLLLIKSALSNATNHKEKENKIIKKREKKLPKRRKDYK